MILVGDIRVSGSLSAILGGEGWGEGGESESREKAWSSCTNPDVPPSPQPSPPEYGGRGGRKCGGRFTARTGRPGFTLIEIMAVISVLLVLIGIIGLTISTLMRIDQADAAAYQRMTDHDRLADQFRADVAQAVSAPEQWGQFQAGKQCLILALDKTTFIVYQRGKEGLQRRYLQADKKELQRLPLGTDAVEFIRTDPRLLKMRITAGEGALARFPNEISAALGGERR